MEIQHLRGLERRAWLTWLGPGLALVLALLAYGLWRAYFGFTRYGIAAAVGWSRLWLAASGLGALLLLVLVSRRWRDSNHFVGLYHNGLRLYLGKRRNRVIRWDQVSHLTHQAVQGTFLGLPINQRNRISLSLKSGEILSLDDRLNNFEPFTEQLKNRYFSSIAPALHRRLEANHWLPFGPLVVHRQALRLRGRRIPWREVQAVSVAGGVLVLKLETGRRLRIPTARIHNLEMLIELIQSGVTT